MAVAWLAAGGRRAAAAGTAWVDRGDYGPFHCVSAFSLAPLTAVFTELSRLQAEMQRTLAIPQSAQDVDIYLLADASSHRRFVQQLYPGVPYRRALYVQRGGQGAVYAYQHEELAIDLRHECTHALLHGSQVKAPLWLDEGLAEYFEAPERDRAFGHPHLTALKATLSLGLVRKVESLESIEELAHMGSFEYRYSWAWVHFMLHGPLPAHRALVEYVSSLRRGHHSARLSDRLRAAVPDLDARIVQHFNYWKRTEAVAERIVT